MPTVTLTQTGVGRIVTTGFASDNAAVVELHGDIDLAVVEPLRDTVVAHADQGTDVLVDLAEVSLIDCASLGVLVEADRLATQRGHRVCLVATPGPISRTLAAAGLGDVFPTFPDRCHALRGLSSQPDRCGPFENRHGPLAPSMR